MPREEEEGKGRVEDMPDSVASILTRIDERTLNLTKDVAEIKVSLSTTYVSQETFKNLAEKVKLHQQILFGIIGLICLSVVGALVKLVLIPGVPHP